MKRDKPDMPLSPTRDGQAVRKDELNGTDRGYARMTGIAGKPGRKNDELLWDMMVELKNLKKRTPSPLLYRSKACRRIGGHEQVKFS